MSGDRFGELRALPAAVVLERLGGDAADPRCPVCRSEVEIHDDDAFGVSLRCRSLRCRLGAWTWPEHALAELRGFRMDEAERLLLTAGREHDERRRRESPREQARRRLAEFLA